MHTWYRAVCDDHLEAQHILVTSNGGIRHDLPDQSPAAEFLRQHYGCALRLIHSDQDTDLLWERYTVNGRPPRTP